MCTKDERRPVKYSYQTLRYWVILTWIITKQCIWENSFYILCTDKMMGFKLTFSEIWKEVKYFHENINSFFSSKLMLLEKKYQWHKLEIFNTLFRQEHLREANVINGAHIAENRRLLQMFFISARSSLNISNKDNSFVCSKWVSNYSLNLLLHV